MTRIVFSGVFDKFPNLKIITHHCGGMVPYFEKRIEETYNQAAAIYGKRHAQGLTKSPIDYFKKFYSDTAIYGSTPGLLCGYDFFGADHIVFATDFPFDSEFGDKHNRLTIQSIEQMDISDSEKKKIFEDNARKLLRLPV